MNNALIVLRREELFPDDELDSDFGWSFLVGSGVENYSRPDM